MTIKELVITVAGTFQRIFTRIGGLGRDSMIAFPYRIINPNCLFIGKNTRIGKYSFITLCREHKGISYTPKFVIGDNVRIGHDFFAGCQNSIIIEDNVLISSRVFIADTLHGYKDISRPIVDQPLAKCCETIIRSDSFIGVGACIMPGVTIRKHAVVGAGSVVTKDVSEFTVVAGNPAVPIEKYSHEKGEWVKTKDS